MDRLYRLGRRQGRQHLHRARQQQSLCLFAADRAAELRLVLAQDRDRQHEADRQYKFYLITSASQTVSVFKEIGTSLSKLRVAR
jgi:hypothetical protein